MSQSSQSKTSSSAVFRGSARTRAEQRSAIGGRYDICLACGHVLAVSHAEFLDLSITLQVERNRHMAAVSYRRAAHTKGALRQYYLMIAEHRDRFADFAEEQLSSRRSATLAHIFTSAVKRHAAEVINRICGAMFNKRFGIYPRTLEFLDQIKIHWRRRRTDNRTLERRI